MIRLKSRTLLLCIIGILAGMLVIANNRLTNYFTENVQLLRMIDRFSLNDLKLKNTTERPSTDEQDLLRHRTSTLAPAANSSTVKQARHTKDNVFRLRDSSPVNGTLPHTSVSTQATSKTTTPLLKNTSNSFTKRTNTTTNSIPEWVQTFHVPRVPFRRVKTPFVFYSYYRSTFFSKCLKLLALSAKDIDTYTPCKWEQKRMSVIHLKP